MNILYRTIYKVERNGKKAYFTAYSIYNKSHYRLDNPDEISKDFAELLTSENVSIHHHGRANLNGEVIGRADGSISFNLSIDGDEILGKYNSIDLKGFLEWVACEGGQVHANSICPGVFDGEYKGISFRYLPKEGWVSVKAADCPPGKGIVCYSIQEFYEAVEYSLSLPTEIDQNKNLINNEN